MQVFSSCTSEQIHPSYDRFRQPSLPDVPLPDEDAGVVNGFGEAELENLSLKTALQEVLDGETQDVIEFHLGLVQHADAHQTTQQGIALGEEAVTEGTSQKN